MTENKSCGLTFVIYTAGTLSVAQRVAREKLAAGESGVDAATAEVRSSTAYCRLNDHEAFRSAFGQWRDDLTGSEKSRLIALTDTVVKVVEAGDARVAMAVLSELGVLVGDKER